MAPPTMATPATMPNFFITFLLKNFALFWGVSVGGDPSDIELCEFHEFEDNDDEWREGVNLSGGE